MIARLEIAYTNGKTDTIVSDRGWRSALGSLVTDAWYSGADSGARRDQVGWDAPRSDLSATATRRDGSTTGWVAAGFAPPPNLYTTEGNAGTTGATQAAQALALDAGLVPDGERPAVLDALVELVHAFHPNGDGPHFSGGTIGMAPTVRALSAGGRDDVLWELLQQDDQPSYGYFLQPTTANPDGMTTIGERWNRGDSKNHMILAQIEEWFHTGLAGIRVDGTRSIVVQPKVVGDLTQVKGSHHTAQGVVKSEWSKTDRSFRLAVNVPENTTAEIWVPTQDGRTIVKPDRARFLRAEAGYSVYRTGSGSYTFTAVPR